VTFDATTRTFTFASTSVTEAGVYTLEVVASLPSPYTSSTSSFDLTVTDPCLTATLTPSTVTTPQTYDIYTV